MKTKWYNWWAQNGDVTAEYEVHRDWGEILTPWLTFKLFIGLEVGDRFYAKVTDWFGNDIVNPKRFGSIKEATDYLADVDCEAYVDAKWEEFQKMI